MTAPRRASQQDLQDNFTDWYYKWVIREQALSAASCNIPWRLVCGLENYQDLDEELWGYNSEEEDLWQEIGRRYEHTGLPDLVRRGFRDCSGRSFRDYSGRDIVGTGEVATSQLPDSRSDQVQFEEVQTEEVQSEKTQPVLRVESVKQADSVTYTFHPGSTNSITITTNNIQPSEDFCSARILTSVYNSENSDQTSRLDSLRRYSSVLSEEEVSCSTDSESTEETESYSYSCSYSDSDSDSEYNSDSDSTSSSDSDPQINLSLSTFKEKPSLKNPLDNTHDNQTLVETENTSSEHFNLSYDRQSFSSSNFSADQLSLYTIESLARSIRNSLPRKRIPSLSASCSANKHKPDKSEPSFKIKLPTIKRPKSRSESKDQNQSSSERLTRIPTLSVTEFQYNPDSDISGSFERLEPARRPIKRRCRHNSYYEQNLRPLLDTRLIRTPSPYTDRNNIRTPSPYSTHQSGREETVEYVFLLNQGVVEISGGVKRGNSEEDITLPRSAEEDTIHPGSVG